VQLDGLARLEGDQSMKRLWRRMQLGLFARTIEGAEREIEALEIERDRQIDLIRQRAETELQEVDARIGFARERLEYRVGFYARKSEAIRAALLDEQVLARRQNRSRGLPAAARHL
jgi:hypothetical protein